MMKFTVLGFYIFCCVVFGLALGRAIFGNLAWEWREMLFVAKKRLRVKTSIENLPTSIEINVAPLDLGDSVLVRDLPRLENVTFTDSDRVSVLSIIKAK